MPRSRTTTSVPAASASPVLAIKMVRRLLIALTSVRIRGRLCQTAPRLLEKVRLAGAAFAGRQRERAQPTEAQHLDDNLLADASVVEQPHQIIDPGDALTVEPHHQIVREEPGAARRRVLLQ